MDSFCLIIGYTVVIVGGIAFAMLLIWLFLEYVYRRGSNAILFVAFLHKKDALKTAYECGKRDAADEQRKAAS